MHPPKQDWTKLRVYPLAERRSLTKADDILISPETAPQPYPEDLLASVRACAQQIRTARERGAGVVLMYGAHLLRNGAALILGDMMKRGWVTHLATNGAATIHDWEYAWLGRSTESVEQNVATGSFGAWDETGRNLHLAMMAGALRGEGYGVALGRFIAEDGTNFPSRAELIAAITGDPTHPLTAARADLLAAAVPEGRVTVEHPWKQASILAQAYIHGVPVTVHPGIGYDIIANHPIFNGAVIGRAAGHDFRLFGDSVETLDGGVVLSVGSAIMAPQVFEKSLSSVNNLRLSAGRKTVSDHTIYVVDLQDGGNWDWTTGEPPKTNAAYYLRFCKSFSRMGGAMHYLQSDNMAFIHNLYFELLRDSSPSR
ncbi:hypothetical protein [Bryobacter aggregatus]|uniref:hypothetical protein n=1 Tax=Bryobacter aggregatus TaxID=360054 RepID=UPI0004E1CB6C|nr:hypothetical protein [Bryobacter aggregatus]